MVVTVAVSDKDPLIRGASFECPPNPPRKGDSPRQVWEISPGAIQESAIRAKGTVLSARVLRTSALTSTSGGASGRVVGYRE